MTRGRKPKPTVLKLIEGNPGRQKINKNEPKAPHGLPQPPPMLSPEAREEWEFIVPGLHYMGVLSEVDHGTIGAYCQAYGRWVQAERAIARMAERDQVTSGLMIRTTNGNAIQNPLVGTANKAMADMVKYAAEIAATPAARARISVGPDDSRGGKFGDLINGKGA